MRPLAWIVACSLSACNANNTPGPAQARNGVPDEGFARTSEGTTPAKTFVEVRLAGRPEPLSLSGPESTYVLFEEPRTPEMEAHLFVLAEGDGSRAEFRLVLPSEPILDTWAPWPGSSARFEQGQSVEELRSARIRVRTLTEERLELDFSFGKADGREVVAGTVEGLLKLECSTLSSASIGNAAPVDGSPVWTLDTEATTPFCRAALLQLRL